MGDLPIPGSNGGRLGLSEVAPYVDNSFFFGNWYLQLRLFARKNGFATVMVTGGAMLKPGAGWSINYGEDRVPPTTVGAATGGIAKLPGGHALGFMLRAQAASNPAATGVFIDLKAGHFNIRIKLWPQGRVPNITGWVAKSGGGPGGNLVGNLYLVVETRARIVLPNRIRLSGTLPQLPVRVA